MSVLAISSAIFIPPVVVSVSADVVAKFLSFSVGCKFPAAPQAFSYVFAAHLPTSSPLFLIFPNHLRHFFPCLKFFQAPYLMPFELVLLCSFYFLLRLLYKLYATKALSNSAYHPKNFVKIIAMFKRTAETNVPITIGFIIHTPPLCFWLLVLFLLFLFCFFPAAALVL